MTESHIRLAIVRSESLQTFYDAERRAGADPLTANERMSEYAKRLDGLQSEYDRDLDVIRRCMERKS